MSFREPIRKKNFSPLSRKSGPNPLQRRRFKVPKPQEPVVRRSPEEQKAFLQQKLEQSAFVGYNGLNVPVKAPETPPPQSVQKQPTSEALETNIKQPEVPEVEATSDEEEETPQPKELSASASPSPESPNTEVKEEDVTPNQQSEAESTHPQSQKPDLQARKERASRLSSNWLKVPVNSPGTQPSPVQRTLSLGALEHQYQPQIGQRANSVWNGLNQFKAQQLAQDYSVQRQDIFGESQLQESQETQPESLHTQQFASSPPDNPEDNISSASDGTLSKLQLKNNKEQKHPQQPVQSDGGIQAKSINSLVQRSASGTTQVSSNLENRLVSSKAGGSPLPNDVRSFMEPRFGADFSAVRVHTDATAVQMNKELGAQAFTHGSDVYYGAGKSPGKNELTAHELTHTIQQGAAKTLQAKPLISWRNKETLLTKPSSSPDLDSPPKTALQLKQNSTPQIEEIHSSHLVQKAATAAPPIPEQDGQPTHGKAQEREGCGGIFAVKKIIDKLGKILSGAGNVIWSIAKDPVSFLGNLVSGLRQGLINFVGNIGTHLQAGLMGWLTGTLGPMGIQLPDDLFSLKGIFSLVTQVLGVTAEYIRTKTVKMFGDATVARMEKSVAIFQRVAQGPEALWEQVSEQFTDLKETVIGQIKNLVITQVIQAGVKWILSLLNPVSGLFKAAMGIYDIITFFINRASQIRELVNAVIAAVKAIAVGQLSGVASLVENALVRSLPVMIGFLASLLGINGLATKVQTIVKKIRTRIDKAIDQVLLKAKRLLKGDKGKTNPDKSSNEAQERQVSGEIRVEHDVKVKTGLTQLEKEQVRYLKQGAIAKEDADQVAAKVKKDNPVFKSITVVDNQETWDYIYVASPPRKKKGPKQASQDNKNLTEAETRIASILQESGYSQEEAEEASQRISRKISKLKPEIKQKSSRLFDFLNIYALELPKKIEDFDEEDNKKRETLVNLITQTNREFDKLANQLGRKNIPVSILIEILGSNDYIEYKRLYFDYQKKKQAYEKQEQDTKDDPQSQESKPVEETQTPYEPMKILKKYGYHWDVARDALAYANGPKRGKERRNQMKTLVDFRSAVVLRILEAAMRKVGSRISGADRGEFTHNNMGATFSLNAPIDEQPEARKEKIAIKAIAPGSSNLTSDYDVTFQIEQFPQHEADLVQVFNQKFRHHFISLGGPGYESGVVFDTNVYTSGFFGKTGSLYTPKTREANQKLALQQLAFSLVAILKGLPQEQWDDFQEEVRKEAKDILNLNREGIKVINKIFKDAKKYVTNTSKQIDKKQDYVMHNLPETLKIENEPENSPSSEKTSHFNKAIEIAAQMHAANRLYERQIKKVSNLIKKYKQAEKTYELATDEEQKREQAEQIDKISINLYKEQSLALIYANEAYYSAGPILHVVGEMQMGLSGITTEKEYLQSLLVQIGYKLQHIQHYEHLFHDVSNQRQKARKLDRVGLLFAKYGYRAIEALQKLNSSFEKAGVAFRLSGRSAKSIVADLEMEFIKKAGTGTPQEKVSQAVKAGGVVSKDLKQGQHLDLKVMQSSWQELAIKVLARIPHLLNPPKSE
jgi:hypothetical protein